MQEPHFKLTKLVRTKNPFLRAVGRLSGVFASFFLKIELRWGDMYEMTFEEQEK